MPHIHTEPGQHDHTVSAYIVRIKDDEPQLLLHRHRLLGKYLPFGGHIELNEDPWMAIEHELLEESGYSFDQLELLQPKERVKSAKGLKLHPVPLVYMTHKFNEEHNHTDAAFAFITQEDPARSVEERESKDFVWFSLAKLRSLSDEDVFEDIKDTGAYLLTRGLKMLERVDPATFS